jgi:hypothetical protein
MMVAWEWSGLELVGWDFVTAAAGMLVQASCFWAGLSGGLGHGCTAKGTVLGPTLLDEQAVLCAIAIWQPAMS